jgi:hypothetical protein
MTTPIKGFTPLHRWPKKKKQYKEAKSDIGVVRKTPYQWISHYFYPYICIIWDGVGGLENKEMDAQMQRVVNDL